MYRIVNEVKYEGTGKERERWKSDKVRRVQGLNKRKENYVYTYMHACVYICVCICVSRGRDHNSRERIETEL